jgi:L-alanine-DL-glutamate epimerase-like enolase superfamily enzyme
VDVLQADATRCAGATGYLRVDALCRSRSMPLSAHTAPSLHAHLCCASTPTRHIEYFHDHARIEHMLFDGAITPHDGTLTPDPSRPGLGIEFKHTNAERFAVAF